MLGLQPGPDSRKDDVRVPSRKTKQQNQLPRKPMDSYEKNIRRSQQDKGFLTISVFARDLMSLRMTYMQYIYLLMLNERERAQSYIHCGKNSRHLPAGNLIHMYKEIKKKESSTRRNSIKIDSTGLTRNSSVYYFFIELRWETLKTRRKNYKLI